MRLGARPLVWALAWLTILALVAPAQAGAATSGMPAPARTAVETALVEPSAAPTNAAAPHDSVVRSALAVLAGLAAQTTLVMPATRTDVDAPTAAPLSGLGFAPADATPGPGGGSGGGPSPGPKKHSDSSSESGGGHAAPAPKKDSSAGDGGKAAPSPKKDSSPADGGKAAPAPDKHDGTPSAGGGAPAPTKPGGNAPTGGASAARADQAPGGTPGHAAGSPQDKPGPQTTGAAAAPRQPSPDTSGGTPAPAAPGAPERPGPTDPTAPAGAAPRPVPGAPAAAPGSPLPAGGPGHPLDPQAAPVGGTPPPTDAEKTLFTGGAGAQPSDSPAVSGNAPMRVDPRTAGVLRDYRQGLPEDLRSAPLDFGSSAVTPDRIGTLVAGQGGNPTKVSDSIQAVGGPGAKVTQSPILLRDGKGAFASRSLFEVSSADGTTHLVDGDGAHYDNMTDYMESNRLGDGWTMVRAARPGEPGAATNELISGPAHTTTTWQKVGRTGDKLAQPAMVVGGAMAVGGAAAIAVSGGAAAPVAGPVAVAGRGLMAAGSGWMLARGGSDLVDRFQHGRSLNPFDPEAQQDYFKIAAGLGGTVGEVGRMTGMPVLADLGDRAMVGVAGAQTATDAKQLYDDWDTLPPEQRLDRTAKLGLDVGLLRRGNERENGLPSQKFQSPGQSEPGVSSNIVSRDQGSQGSAKFTRGGQLPSADDLIKGGSEWSGKGRGGGKVPRMGGPPNGTLYRRNPQDGKVSSYTVYDENGDAIKRVDLEGRPHTGPDGTVETPHAVDLQSNEGPNGRSVEEVRGSIRKARPDEIPK